MTDRWSRLAPLTGVLFGIIVVVAIITGGGETPDANARPAGTGVEYGLAHQLRHLGPEVAQTLNFLDNELFLPVLAGAFVFGISSGLAILRGVALPKWLGWVAIVLGVIALIPPTGFFALLGFVIWTVVASILMYRRTGAPIGTGAASSQPAL
jgi:hypothetical protein